jgi:hypothetical protein
VALAYLICWRERGAAEALALLDPTRHRANRLVITLGSSILGDPAILDEFDAWHERHAQVRLADYHDEMEAEFEALLRDGGRDRITGADLGEYPAARRQGAATHVAPATTLRYSPVTG